MVLMVHFYCQIYSLGKIEIAFAYLFMHNVQCSVDIYGGISKYRSAATAAPGALVFIGIVPGVVDLFGDTDTAPSGVSFIRILAAEKSIV